MCSYWSGLTTLFFVMAGAVHPERNEGRWEPRYNFMGLWMGNSGG